MNTLYKPDFKLNIDGCLKKYGDISGTLKWFLRAEKELSNEEFIQLVDSTIEDKYRHEQCFSQIFAMRDKKSINIMLDKKSIDAYGIKGFGTLLVDYRYENADEHYLKQEGLFNETKYMEQEQKYKTKKHAEYLRRKISAECSISDKDVLSLAHIVVQNDPALYNVFSWEGLKAFIMANIDSVTFPNSVYLSILKEIADEMKRGIVNYDKNAVAEVLEKVLSFSDKGDAGYEIIWVILFTNKSLLKKFSSSHKIFLDKLADTYPLENLIRFAPFYLPPENICLNYLKNDQIPLDRETYDQLQSIFKMSRYFNCEMILALTKAKCEYPKINLNDILGALKKIVNRAMNHNLEFKNPIKNQIFPKCISDYQKKGFQVSRRDLVFCEGKLWKRRVLCRNQQCIERTRMVNVGDKVQPDNYFFRFLKTKFGISSNDILWNKGFALAMGNFNRWNEIAERIICGYGQTAGCGSPLIYCNSPQVSPGWAAFATTYWRCSMSSCHHVEKEIKLSNCAGCGRIIDSRFDKVSCNRRDGKMFFICMDCGYCCDEHMVSGICPKCEQNKRWKNLDRYGKRYQCAACGHKIAVPLRFKGSLGPMAARLHT